MLLSLNLDADDYSLKPITKPLCFRHQGVPSRLVFMAVHNEQSRL